MGNRIYLYCTDFEQMPNESEWDHFFAASGIEYEAQGHLPFLWLALFDEASIRIDPGNRNGFTDDERAYAYLFDKKDLCIIRMQHLFALVSHLQGNIVVCKIGEWIQRLKAEPHKNIIVRTEELDWMSQEGTLELDLRKSLRQLNLSISRSEIIFSNAVRDLCGLSEIDELLTSEPSWLLGGANTPLQWPESSELKLPTQHSTPRKKKPWWKPW